MKHLSLFGCLSLLFILSTAFTCTDHRDLPPAARFRVKTINYTTTGDSSASALFNLLYGADGRLASVRSDLYSGRDAGRRDVIYNSNSNIDAQIFTAWSESKVTVYFMLYNIDKQNRVTRMSFTDASLLRSFYTYDFTYNGTGTMPLSRTITEFSRGTPSESKTENYTFINGNAAVINGISYAYDTSPNPYKGLVGFSSFLFVSPDFNFGFSLLNRPFSISERFSDSSVKAFNQNNRTTNAQLTYNSNGLVTRIAYTDGNSEEFTYETY